jgi:hypothetical protein
LVNLVKVVKVFTMQNMSLASPKKAMDAGENEFTTIVIILDYIDTFVIVFFTAEYVIRFICSPRKCR